MKTTLKSAAAFFAFFAMTSAAFAEDVSESTHIIDNGAVLENIYAAMERNRMNAFQLVLATAETRLEDRMAELDNDANQPSFMVASN